MHVKPHGKYLHAMNVELLYGSFLQIVNLLLSESTVLDNWSTEELSSL